MRNILLTVNVNCKDEYFMSMEGIEKLDIGDIIKSRKIIKDIEELENNRGRVVVETILEKSGDLLIGYAIQKIGQLADIIRRLENHEVIISAIFYDNGKRKEHAINKYKEKYKLHSNWMDYSPEFIESKYEEFEEKVKEIIIEARANNIRIEAI